MSQPFSHRVREEFEINFKTLWKSTKARHHKNPALKKQPTRLLINHSDNESKCKKSDARAALAPRHQAIQLGCCSPLLLGQRASLAASSSIPRRRAYCPQIAPIQSNPSAPPGPPRGKGKLFSPLGTTPTYVLPPTPPHPRTGLNALPSDTRELQIAPAIQRASALDSPAPPASAPPPKLSHVGHIPPRIQLPHSGGGFSRCTTSDVVTEGGKLRARRTEPITKRVEKAIGSWERARSKTCSRSLRVCSANLVGVTVPVSAVRDSGDFSFWITTSSPLPPSYAPYLEPGKHFGLCATQTSDGLAAAVKGWVALASFCGMCWTMKAAFPGWCVCCPGNPVDLILTQEVKEKDLAIKAKGEPGNLLGQPLANQHHTSTRVMYIFQIFGYRIS